MTGGRRRAAGRLTTFRVPGSSRRTCVRRTVGGDRQMDLPKWGAPYAVANVVDAAPGASCASRA